MALTHNFRSRKELLDVVNTVFGGRFPDYTPLADAGGADAPGAPSVAGSRRSSCC